MILPHHTTRAEPWQIPVARPSWGSVTRGVVLGLAALAAVLVPAWLLLLALGVPLMRSEGELTIGRWPYAADGPWSVAANLTMAAIVLGLATLLVQRSVARATGLPVSWPRSIVVLAITMPVPAASVRGAIGVSGLAALAVAIAGVRYLATGRESPPRPGRRELLLLTAAGVAAVGVAVAYVVTHPFAPRVTVAQLDERVWQLGLETGHLGATVTGVAAAHVDIELEPIQLPVDAPARASATALVRAPSCPVDADYLYRIDALDVRYRLLGGTHRQRLALAEPWVLSCRG